MRLLRDNILVEIEEKKVSDSGIILAGDDELSVNYVKVIYVSKEVKEVKEGDRVIVPKFQARKLRLEGKDYAIISEEDVIIIL